MMIDEEKQWDILRLYHIEGMSVRRISTELGLHRNTVNKYLMRIEECEFANEYVVHPQSKGRWVSLLMAAKKNVIAQKKGKKINIKDVFDEIKDNQNRYIDFGLRYGESINISTFYLAWREMKTRVDKKED